MVDGVPSMLMRGGSSKGAYFLASDLPTNVDERDDLLRRIMGSPDARQIDGVGGAHPLTSKVAIVGPRADDRADVEYLFLQVGVDTDQVSDRQNCGNLLAGVGPFSLERGLIDATDGETSVRILMRNTDTVATAKFSTLGGLPVYEGDTSISGVPGTAAAIGLDFDGLAGGSCGTLLPTGNSADLIEGIECTLVDNGMPVVVIRASDLGVTGAEACAELEANEELRATLEAIRLAAGPLMNLGDVADTTVPKLTMVSPPTGDGHLSTRTFIPHRCHDAIGVLGAVSVATAALIPDSPASDVLVDPDGDTVRLEHPTGFFDATVDVSVIDGGIDVRRTGIVRTARKLMDGLVFRSLFNGDQKADAMATINPPHDFPLDRTVAGPRPEASKPAVVTPPPHACDAHCHVFGPAKDFPFSPSRSYTPPDSGVDGFLALQDRLGLSRAVFVQASCHGTDNSAMIDAIQRAPERFAGVAMIDESFTDDDLVHLHANNVRGIRFNFVAHLGGAPDMDVFWRLVHRVAPLGWHVVMHLDAKDFGHYGPVLDAMPVPYVIDHMARVPAIDGLDQEPLRLLLDRMTSDDKCWVKISCAERLTEGRIAPYDDVVPIAQAVVAAAPDRILWGTDWPHPNLVDMPDEGELLDLLGRIVPDETLRNRILVDNPVTLYDFGRG